MNDAKQSNAFLGYTMKQEVTMKKNMGCVDRVLRSLAAVAIVVLIVLKVFSGTLLIVLGILAAMFLITSAVGFCPLYVPLRISTIPKKKSSQGLPGPDGDGCRPIAPSYRFVFLPPVPGAVRPGPKYFSLR